ncbi:hypothetical protein KIN20_033196 [Parelaphostrongylus tenuis]|uniref:Piwi domain-containing protein n=1 Tax=Parelaphostrongylus tenuis TaxID=148309 RepID=A0AAD5R892_PARTN|nr:hypothetical protein KIN20_033196 [Parelaphostrongylus tenuis]
MIRHLISTMLWLPRHLYSELNSGIEEHFRSIVGKVSLAIFVTKIKKDPIHDFIKLLEAKHGVVTQHVCTATVMACCQNRARIIENVLLKMNVKCGGINHVVLPTAVALGNRTSQRDMDGRIFGGKMFVGFELSHPAAQSLYSRQNKQALKEPTVIGFAYSTGLPTDYTGRWWYQKPRLSKIQYIRNYFGTAFTDYFNQNKSLPTEIVVYRSGASEGEFCQVEEEANEIRAAAESMRDMNNGKNYRPRITVIVAQTKSNYRIIPASLARERDHNLKASQANVPSGTCVDADIVSPRFKEFIMASQQPNIGTSRPVRYTIVVEDGPGRSVSEAEHITHFLCHGHQQSVLPTRVPAILYAAENLAKRGRSAWMTKLNADFNEKASMSPLRVSLTGDESEAEFYIRISRELMNSLPNHYFA